MLSDNKLVPSAGVAQETILVPIVTAISQTDAVVAVLRPGYNFTVVKVESYTRTIAATVTFDVLVGANVIANDKTPVAGTRTEHTFETGYTNIRDRKGGPTTDVTVRYTSNGTGVLTNGYVLVTIRPFPMAGEAW